MGRLGDSRIRLDMGDPSWVERHRGQLEPWARVDLQASRGYFVANCVEFDVWGIALGDRPVDG